MSRDEQRLQQIRQVEEEIAELEDDLSWYKNDGRSGSGRLASIYGRILAREQAALAELKRGMKEGTNG